MAEFPWMAAVSGLSNIASGFLGSSENAKSRGMQERLSSENMWWQQHMANHGIEMRVDDAKRAGIHPLAALGSPLIQPSPVQASFGGNNAWASAASNFGQDVSRSMMATRTQTERDATYMNSVRELQAEGLVLDNEMKRSQIARFNSMPNPAFPGNNNMIPGQGNTPPNSIDTARIIREGLPGSAVATPPVPDLSYMQGRDGQYPTPSKEGKELIEDNIFQEAAHFLRNNIMPMFGMNLNPSRPADKDMEWYYHPIFGYRQRLAPYNPKRMEELRRMLPFMKPRHTYRGPQGY